MAHQYVRHMVERGELGEVYYVKAPSIRRRGVPLWGVFLDKEKQGGGPLIDIGTHSIDAALSLIGNYDVESVTGSVYRKLSETRYRKPDGEEYSTYRLLDGNQKIVYAMDDTLLEPYKMLARAPSLEPDLGKALLEQAEELYYQKGDHAFDTIYDFMRDALEDKDPRWAN